MPLFMALVEDENAFPLTYTSPTRGEGKKEKMPLLLGARGKRNKAFFMEGRRGERTRSFSHQVRRSGRFRN